MSNDLTLDDLPQPEWEGTIPPDELSTDSDNPNEQSDEMFGLLCENLRRKGWIGNAIVTDTDGLIADGEHRWRAAQEIGLDEVPVKQYELSDAERRLWRQELNKISGEHDRKRDALEYDYLLSNGKADDVQALTNAAGEDLDELLAEITLTQEQRVPYEYDSEHTIYFEDCVEGMRDQLDDDSVDCIVTDPPYGFDYVARGEQEFDSLANFDDWQLFEDALDEFRRVATSSAHVYVWWGWQFYGRMEPMFRERFDHLDTLIWVKNNFGINANHRDRYRPQYEVCFHGVLDDPRELNDANSLSNVLEYPRDAVGEYEHPTQKPVGLLSELIYNSTDPGDLILDAFVGSGSTAVAAIQANRDIVGFEIDEENYRPVIERRVSEAQRQIESPTNRAE